MTDREKVIKGLVRCIEKQDAVINRNHGFNCIACPYIRRCESIGYLIGLPLMRDALALLKAQEPVEPIRMNHTENKYRDYYRCPICKEDLSYEQNYCPYCGRKVKWQ